MSRLGALVAKLLPLFPRWIVWRVARRYVAGEGFDDAVRAARELSRLGAVSTLALVGEEVQNEDEVEEAAVGYLEVLETIDRERLESNISVKPTHLGLRLSKELLHVNVWRLCEEAAERKNFVRLDMEDHTCTDATLEVFETVHREPGHVGVVLQAMLHRTVEDIEALPEKELNVRLCKGIYLEPPDISFQHFEEIQASFMQCLKKLFEKGAYVGIATHDDELIEESLAMIDDLGLSKDDYEFQMLYGVRPDLRRRLLAEDHRLRVYVPFGPDWYAYSMRRLRENPQVVSHIVRAMFGMK
jgi:proline dehydrogenase